MACLGIPLKKLCAKPSHHAAVKSTKAAELCVHVADVFNFTKIIGVTLDLPHHIQYTEFIKSAKFSGASFSEQKVLNYLCCTENVCLKTVF